MFELEYFLGVTKRNPLGMVSSKIYFNDVADGSHPGKVCG
jgi:hypothetical protein